MKRILGILSVALLIFCVGKAVFATETASIFLKKDRSIFLKKDDLNGQKFKMTSSDETVVAVHGGLLCAVKEGSARITRQKDGVELERCEVTVVPFAGVKNFYILPNNPKAGEQFELVVIADSETEKVKISVANKPDIFCTKFNTDGGNRVFSATLQFSAGNFAVRFSAFKNGNWHDDFDAQGELFVSLKDSDNTPGGMRASEKLINFIKIWEGFSPKIHKDSISVKKVLDIGYGHVVREKEPFFNNITMLEGEALLRRLLNSPKYSGVINKFLKQNSIILTQNEFDALLSFTYNLGIGWLENSDLRDVILAERPKPMTIFGEVTPSGGLNVRRDSTVNSEVISRLNFGEKVEILSLEKFGRDWLKVRTAAGMGFCHSDFLKIQHSYQKPVRFSDIPREKIAAQWLRWHHCGNGCVRGLMLRRLAELGVLFDGVYRKISSVAQERRFPLPECYLRTFAGRPD